MNSTHCLVHLVISGKAVAGSGGCAHALGRPFSVPFRLHYPFWARRHHDLKAARQQRVEHVVPNGPCESCRLVDAVQTDPAVAATPSCVLYSTDTVGGNSGSPVLDADGRFIAINFDRQRQGLMNEFKWSRDYSRSIGTDVRMILYLVGTYDGAQWLVDEMVD